MEQTTQEELFDTEGRDLEVQCVKDAKLLKQGDILVFHPRNRELKAWRIEKDGRRVIFSAHLPIVDTKIKFQHLVRVTGDVARLGKFVEESSVPEPFWAFRFLED